MPNKFEIIADADDSALPVTFCKIFYCDKVGDRICCCDCPLLDECPTRNGPCLNDPERCGSVDRSERKTKT